MAQSDYAPTPSTSSPNANSPPRAPSHARIDTDGLIKAGTVALDRCAISDELVALVCSCGRAWVGLERGMIRQAQPSISVERQADLERLLVLQDAHLLRLSVSVHAVLVSGSPQSFENCLVVRVHLVPADAAPGRAKKARLGATTILAGLGMINVDQLEWQIGERTGAGRHLLDEEDKRSLLDLYRAVDSPSPSSASIEQLDAPPAIKARLRALAAPRGDPLPGAKTPLFVYQLNSVLKMLTKELCPQLVPSPAYRLVRSVDGSAYWISYEGDVRREPPMVREPVGGILAEEMGSGKTFIVLSLVLSTLGELPSLAQVSPHLDGTPGTPPPLLTDISRKWPTTKARDEANRSRRRVVAPLEGTEGVLMEAELREYELARAREEEELARREEWTLPTLREIALDLVKTTSLAVPKLSGLPEQIEKDLAATVPSYVLHPSPAQVNTRAGRSQRIPSQKIIVSPTTLIVVPPGLVRQWMDEIETHLEKGALRMLMLKKATASFTAEQIAASDVVLMSTTVFAAAAEDLKSPLRRVHVKRLVVDEGHVLSGTNRLRTFAEELHCESRWAVSGTPTSSLRSAHDSDESLAGSASGSLTDFDRLGQLVARFLRHPAFPQPAVWRAVFTNPILEQARGASRLLGVLNNVMVKNRPEETHRDHPLPKLIKETVFLEIENGAERKMYNALLALFVVNDVTSQRKDKDYFFHPDNSKYCDELALNLAASSFFFTSPQVANTLQTAVDNAKEALGSEKAAGWSERDRSMLGKAIGVIEEALCDDEWRQITLRQHVQVEVAGLEGELFRALGGLAAQNNSTLGRDLMPFGGLVSLRGHVNQLCKTTVEGEPSWRDDEELEEEVLTILQRVAREEYTPAKVATGDNARPLRPIPDDSALRRVRMGSTTSAKLNWVLNEVKRCKDDKFVIFSSTLPDLVFSAISEAFDLHAVPHTIYASHSSNEKRSEAAFDFNHLAVTSCQVILVDAKLGGRGINLTAASRVVFLEPIWQADMLVQAEKRAHRLGQTRDVIQKTLVIKDSWEDEVRKRRLGMAANDVASKKAPQRDERLGEVLRSAQWLEPTERGDGEAQPGSEWTPFEIELKGEAQSSLKKRGMKRRRSDGAGGGALAPPPSRRRLSGPA